MNLRTVNKSLKEIKEDTGQLNQNFDQWFDDQKRQRLRDEEDRREQKRSTGAGAAAGVAGGLGLAASGGVGADGAVTEGEGEGDTNSVFGNIAKGYLVTRAAGAAFRLAGRSIRGSAKLIAGAATTFTAATRKLATGDPVRTGPDAKTKAMADTFSDIEGDADRAKAQADANRKLKQEYLRGRNTPEALQGQQLLRDERIRIENAQRTKKTLERLALRRLQNINAASVVPSPTVKMPTPTIDTGISAVNRAAPSALQPPSAPPSVPSKLPNSISRPIVDATADIKNIRVIQNGNKISYIEDGKFIKFEDGKIRLAAAGFDETGRFMGGTIEAPSIATKPSINVDTPPPKVAPLYDEADPRRAGAQAPTAEEAQRIKNKRIAKATALKGLGVAGILLETGFIASASGEELKNTQGLVSLGDVGSVVKKQAEASILGGTVDFITGLAGFLEEKTLGKRITPQTNLQQNMVDAYNQRLEFEKKIGYDKSYFNLSNLLGLNSIGGEGAKNVVISAGDVADQIGENIVNTFKPRPAEVSGFGAMSQEDFLNMATGNNGGVYIDNSTTNNLIGENGGGAPVVGAPDSQVMTEDTVFWKRLFTFGQDRD